MIFEGYVIDSWLEQFLILLVYVKLSKWNFSRIYYSIILSVIQLFNWMLFLVSRTPALIYTYIFIHINVIIETFTSLIIYKFLQSLSFGDFNHIFRCIVKSINLLKSNKQKKMCRIRKTWRTAFQRSLFTSLFLKLSQKQRIKEKKFKI